MKQNLLFIIVISILLTLCLSACSEETAPLPDISDYNSEAFIPITPSAPEASEDSNESEGSEESAQSSQPPQTPISADGFSVKERKYTYLDTGVVLLNVENKTQKNYNLTIRGTYLDENGAVIGEETKTFEGFAAGWQNYFMFWPEFMFDKFTYKIEVEEFTGECVASKMKIQWVPGKVIKVFSAHLLARPSGDVPSGGFEKYPTLSVPLRFTNEGELPMNMYFHYIVLDSKGEIYFIKYLDSALFESIGAGKMRNPMMATYPPKEEDEKQLEIAYSLDKDDIEMPERLKDGFTILVAVTSAEWDPSWQNNGGEE